MLLSSRQKKQERTLEKRDRDGYPGLIPIGEVYGFEQFLTRERDWHSAITSGNELMHVYRRVGEEVIVWFKEKPRTTIDAPRHGPLLLLSDIQRKEGHLS